MLVFGGKLQTKMIYFIAAIVILFILVILVSFSLVVKLNRENASKTKQTALNILESKGFFAHKILVVNKILSFAINKEFTKLAVIRNFNPNFPETFSYEEIITSFIYEIEKNNFNIKINYVKHGDKNTLYISPVKKETKDFFYEILKSENFRKIENKYPSYKFDLCTTSDWNCTHTWAYSPNMTTFAFYVPQNKISFGTINLRKEHFTIDIKYNYFETLFYKNRSQLLIYEPIFLEKLYKSVLETIKKKTNTVLKNMIYFDNYNNILYLSNGYSSIQSLLLDKIEEVYYYDNKLYFTLLNKEQPLNVPANQELINGFVEFITGHNLRKIANNFDYKVDKLINTTSNTKLIVDITRDRLIYCANLDKIAHFSFMTIPFLNIRSVSVEKFGNKSFIRILTKNKEAVDVSCNKNEIAHYILGLLNKIILK